MSRTQTKSILFFIFAISGFSGIIYESIWTHYLKLFLGHAAYAQTLVLAIFMGGMAMGAWLCSIYSVRWKNLLLAYALAEGGVSDLIEGETGVFKIEVSKKEEGPKLENYTTFANSLQASNGTRVNISVFNALKENSEITDNRATFY